MVKESFNSEVENYKNREEKQYVNSKGKKKLIFWNIAGIWSKDRDFWNFIEEGDFVSLLETWLEEKDRKRIENKLPQSFCWKIITARREAIKDRVRGGFIIGIKKDWKLKNIPETEETEEGLIKTKIESSGGKMVIWSVYNSGKVEKYMEYWINQEEIQENDTIIGGDFNIRTGEGGTLVGTQGSTREQDKEQVKIEFVLTEAVN